MMRSTSRDSRQIVLGAQLGIKGIALLLRAGILPIRRVRMRKRILQCLYQRRSLGQTPKQRLALVTPIHASVLLAGARDASDALKWTALGLETRKHEVNGLKPHGYRRVDFALGFFDEDAFLDAILGKVGVKVGFGFIEHLER